MNAPQIRPDSSTSEATALEPLYEVVLHNDDVNSMDHVVEALMRVFGHPVEIAVRIMLEAHYTGRAVAEVEGEAAARRHRDELQSLGLTATIHPL